MPGRVDAVAGSGEMQPDTTPHYIPQPPKPDPMRILIVLLAALLVAVVLGDALVYQATLNLTRAIQQIPSPGPTVAGVIVFFADPRPAGLGERLTIASVSQSLEIQNYQVNMWVGGDVGAPMSRPLLGERINILSIGGAYYRVNWTETNANTGLLVSGDSFEVTHTNATGATFYPFPGATRFVFMLLFADGSLVSNMSFTTP
jgi:hypothetical protein